MPAPSDERPQKRQAGTPRRSARSAGRGSRSRPQRQRKTDPSQRLPATEQKPGRKTVSGSRADALRQVAIGLWVQGAGLSVAVVLPLLVMILWTFGYVPDGWLRLGWVALIVGAVVQLIGEVLCLRLPDKSQARRIGMAALGCAAVWAAGVALLLLSPSQHGPTRLLLEVLLLILLAARLALAAQYLSRIAALTGQSVYETRAIFAMVGMPLAVAAMFAYWKLAPSVLVEQTTTYRLVLRGIQSWIVITVVAVSVMYFSILLGMGNALRRDASPARQRN